MSDADWEAGLWHLAEFWLWQAQCLGWWNGDPVEAERCRRLMLDEVAILEKLWVAQEGRPMPTVKEWLKLRPAQTSEPASSPKV